MESNNHKKDFCLDSNKQKVSSFNRKKLWIYDFHKRSDEDERGSSYLFFSFE